MPLFCLGMVDILANKVTFFFSCPTNRLVIKLVNYYFRELNRQCWEEPNWHLSALSIFIVQLILQALWAPPPQSINQVWGFGNLLEAQLRFPCFVLDGIKNLE